MTEHIGPFRFPRRGFHLVADKIAEADYFLDCMRPAVGTTEFRFLFSAFVSAARSITFTLQAVMDAYPGFESWYAPRQQRLASNKLARFFVQLRNHLQKVGSAPLDLSGIAFDGQPLPTVTFLPDEEQFTTVPSGEVMTLSREYLIELLRVISECYRDYDVYIDPRVMFTERGLAALHWSVEDLEESLGFPRGHTDIPWHGPDKTAHRLAALRRYGGDELVDEFLAKYGVGRERA